MTSSSAPVDTIVELKVQDRGGSTDEKLVSAIRSSAHTWDTYGLAAVVVHSLCPRVVGHGYLEDLERLASASLVGFIAVEDLTEQVLRSQLESLASRRTELTRWKTVESLALLHSPEELAWAARAAEQRIHAAAASGAR